MNSSSESSSSRRIVIIGAVAAGTSAAAKARRNDETAEIIIYDADRYISYSGCGLPYYIGGIVDDIRKLTPRDPTFFRKKYRIEVKIAHRVESFDPERKILTVRNLESNEIFTDNYDILVLATGANPVRLPVPGTDLPHVFTLRNPADAIAIRRFIEENKPKTAAIIGSGFIGLEVADNLSLRGIGITVIEKLPDICPILDPDMAVHLEKHLKSEGVRIRTGITAEHIGRSEVILSDGESIPADMVILSVGARPNVTLARDAGVKIGPTGAISVDDRQRTNIQDVFACGDCAENFFTLSGKPFYRPLGSTANKTGRITGDVITGGDFYHRGVLGTGIFETFGMAVAGTGLTEKDARNQGFDTITVHNIKTDRPEYMGGKEMIIKAIADRKSHTLLGVQIVGFDGVDKRMDVFVTAMTARMTAEDLFHLDLSYAPPFSNTKDPVMYTGMILENELDRGRALIRNEELVQNIDNYTVIDTRSREQYQTGHVPDACNIPHENLRDEICVLDPEKPVVTYCNKGGTGNAAQNILLNRGFSKVYNLSGGYSQYRAQQKIDSEEMKNDD